MQLSIKQQVKLDLVIERYTDDIAMKDGKVIEDYLNTLKCSERELLITVYIYLKRTIKSQQERNIIEKHKSKIYNLLLEKGIIKDEEQRTIGNIASENLKKPNTENTVEQRANKEKIEKLNRYKNLTEIVEALDDRLYLLIEKKESQSHVKAIDYSKERTKLSPKRYEFNGINLLSAIQETEEQLKHYISELQQERAYLLDVFDKLSCIRTSEVYRLRYIELKTWKEISQDLRMSVTWCIKQHDEYIEELEL
ncbi:hypothetical protein [Gemella morbillorum]|uniref:hypothetical protein n=1 Tax=Gemella morbillorum TaxID=29391 RepID=UPI00319DDC22